MAVDFLVGRWTRPHKDVDLIALSSTRKFLRAELSTRNFFLAQDGEWTTRWSLPGDGAAGPEVEIVFVEAAEPHTGVLVIPPGDRHGGRAGRYPLLPDCLNPFRFATLDGVRFRVCSAEAEWFARTASGTLVPGRTLEPRIVQDLEHLKPLVQEARRRELSAQGVLAAAVR